MPTAVPPAPSSAMLLPIAAAASSGRRVVRQRRASWPASRSAMRAAANPRSASTGRAYVPGKSSGCIASLGEVPEKKYLFTPGPTPVPPEVLAALAAPVVHHRSPDFRPIYERCLGRLRAVCRTQRDVLLFTASGTGAFESAVANLVSPGEPHLVVSAGSFGERWAAMVAGFGGKVDPLSYAWGETPDAADVGARLREHPSKAVWVV